MPKSTSLAEEVAKVAERVRKATKSKLNEQNTKASMIEPVLRALTLAAAVASWSWRLAPLFDPRVSQRLAAAALAGAELSSF